MLTRLEVIRPDSLCILMATRSFLFSAVRSTLLARPQYIYGPLTNKRDYLDFFFDRVVHGLDFVPLPVHGDQLVALTHAEDVASMLVSVVGNGNAVKQVKLHVNASPSRRLIKLLTEAEFLVLDLQQPSDGTRDSLELVA